MRRTLCILATLAGASVSMAQVPLPFQDGLRAPAKLAPALVDSLRAKAGQYPFAGYRFIGDSALLVFEDSTMTAAAVTSHTWMFGPPTTKAEEDGCPPEKVLGRRLARIFWRGAAKDSGVKIVMVAVHGTKGGDRWTAETMFYYPSQLEGAWAGEPAPMKPSHNAEKRSELIAVYIGTDGTDRGMVETVRQMQGLLTQQASASGRRLIMRGVSLEPGIDDGIAHLATFGRFDEISVGGNWTNSTALRYLGSDIGENPKSVIPQVVLLEREVTQETQHLSVGPERELARFAGASIRDWVARGARVP
jgi:hypothetical protein